MNVKPGLQFSATDRFSSVNRRGLRPVYREAVILHQSDSVRFGMAVTADAAKSLSSQHRSTVDAVIAIAAAYGAKLPGSKIFREQMSLQIYDEAMQEKIARHAFRNLPATFAKIKSKRPGFNLTIGYVPPKDDKHPVFILSPGADGRIDDMRPLILALVEKGYGVLAHQYAVKNKAGQMIYDFGPVDQSIADDVNSASEWLEKKGIGFERHILAGSSIGGPPGAQVAADHPERDYKMVMLGSPNSMGDFSETWIKTESHPRVWTFFDKLARKRIQAAINVLKNWFNMEVLERVGKPVLVLSGDQDHSFAKTMQRANDLREQGKKNIQTGLIKGANHNNMLNSYLTDEPTRGTALSPDVDDLEKYPQPYVKQVVAAIEEWLKLPSS